MVSETKTQSKRIEKRITTHLCQSFQENLSGRDDSFAKT